MKADNSIVQKFFVCEFKETHLETELFFFWSLSKIVKFYPGRVNLKVKSSSMISDA